MRLKPYSATRTGVDVADELRALIQSGELVVGARLPPQRMLADQLSVGRQAVSEALSLLAAEGYLTIRRGAHGGSFVREPDRSPSMWLEQLRSTFPDLLDVLDFRIGIESQIARLAAERRTTEEIAEMQSAIDALPAGPVDRADFRQADARFHSAMSRAARNVRLEDALRRARAELFVPTDNFPFTETVEVSRRQHQAILRAVELGDGSAAARATRVHIEETRRHLRALVEGEVDR